jgi:hypothetical protein
LGTAWVTPERLPIWSGGDTPSTLFVRDRHEFVPVKKPIYSRPGDAKKASRLGGTYARTIVFRPRVLTDRLAFLLFVFRQESALN